MAKLENEKTVAVSEPMSAAIIGSGNMLLIPALSVMLPRSAILSVAFDVYEKSTSTLIPDTTPNFPTVSQDAVRSFDASIRIVGNNIDFERINTLGLANVWSENGDELLFQDDEEVDEDDDDTPESFDEDTSEVKIKLAEDNGIATIYFTGAYVSNLKSEVVSLKMSDAYQYMASKKDNAAKLEKNLDVMARYLDTIRKTVGVIDDLDAGDDVLDAVNGGGTAQKQQDEDAAEALERFEERVEFFKTKVVESFNNLDSGSIVTPSATDGDYFAGIGEALSVILVDVA